MKYPVAVWFTEGQFTAEVPDLPGVVTQASSLEELEEMVQEAALGWMEGMKKRNLAIPPTASFDTHLKNEDFKGCSWMIIDLMAGNQPT